MISTHIIGKHLNHLDGKQISRCCMCGAEKIDGLPRKEVLSSSFMDWDCIQDGDGVCIYCAACFGIGQERTEYLRFTNFVATPSRLDRFKREEIWPHLMAPPSDEPFVFGVTYSYKKHVAFRAAVNQPGSRPVLVQTENGRVAVYPENIKDLIAVLQSWYTICRDTAQAPTYFAKADILSGCRNYKRIEEYGIDDYLRENEVIAPFRGTALLELLVYALNKGELKIRESQKRKEKEDDQFSLSL